MTSSPAPSRPPDTRLCGYRLHSWLKAPRSALCIDAGTGKRLVLKQLPRECLQGSALHPLVRDRLARVQHLPHLQVATLLGVERDAAGESYLVWEYVEGMPLEQYLSDPARAPRQVLLMLRELLLATEGLHSLGIVHGALYARNVIITPRGELKLTHVSPLLHQDPLADTQSVSEMLRHLIDARGERHSPLGQLIARRAAEDAPLLELAADIGRLADKNSQKHEPPGENPGVEAALRRRSRRLAIACAGGALLLGALAGWQLWQRAQRPSRPPQAPPELLQPRLP